MAQTVKGPAAGSTMSSTVGAHSPRKDTLTLNILINGKPVSPPLHVTVPTSSLSSQAEFLAALCKTIQHRFRPATATPAVSYYDAQHGRYFPITNASVKSVYNGMAVNLAPMVPAVDPNAPPATAAPQHPAFPPAPTPASAANKDKGKDKQKDKDKDKKGKGFGFPGLKFFKSKNDEEKDEKDDKNKKDNKGATGGPAGGASVGRATSFAGSATGSLISGGTAPNPNAMPCPSCGHSTAGKFCNRCGGKMPDTHPSMLTPQSSTVGTFGGPPSSSAAAMQATTHPASLGPLPGGVAQSINRAASPPRTAGGPVPFSGSAAANAATPRPVGQPSTPAAAPTPALGGNGTALVSNDAAAAEIAKLKKRVKELEATVQSLDDEAEKDEKHIETLKSNLAAETKKRIIAEKAAESVSSSKSGFDNAAREAAEQRADDAEVEVERLRDRILSLEAARAAPPASASDAELASLQQEISSLKGQLATMQASKEAADSKIALLTAETESFKSQLAASSKTAAGAPLVAPLPVPHGPMITALEARIASLEDCLQEKEVELNQLRRASGPDASNLVAQVRDAKMQLSRETARCDGLQRAIEKVAEDAAVRERELRLHGDHRVERVRQRERERSDERLAALRAELDEERAAMTLREAEREESRVRARVAEWSRQRRRDVAEEHEKDHDNSASRHTEWLEKRVAELEHASLLREAGAGGNNNARPAMSPQRVNRGALVPSFADSQKHRPENGKTRNGLDAALEPPQISTPASKLQRGRFMNSPMGHVASPAMPTPMTERGAPASSAIAHDLENFLSSMRKTLARASAAAKGGSSSTASAAATPVGAVVNATPQATRRSTSDAPPGVPSFVASRVPSDSLAASAKNFREANAGSAGGLSRYLAQPRSRLL